MGFIQGEGRTQGTLFPVVLDDLVPGGHMCRVIDAFVGRLEISQLGFERDDPVLHFYQTSMATFVLEMSGPAPIEDRTGLRGKYEFDLTRLGTDGVQSSDWDLAPLGLKLIPAKIPTVNIVIDHIERPSPN